MAPFLVGAFDAHMLSTRDPECARLMEDYLNGGGGALIKARSRPSIPIESRPKQQNFAGHSAKKYHTATFTQLRGMMADWTEDEKREFAEYRRKGREDAEREAARSAESRRKGREDAEREAAGIHAGDLVDTPDGPGVAIEEREGGFFVRLDADLLPERSGTFVSGMSRQGAFFVPLNLLRKRR